MKLPEDAITKLYAVPLDAFPRERNALATAMTKAGHADQARAVRQLRRPSAPLWATNQLARVDSDRLEAFLDSVVQIRKTQLRDPRAAAEALTQQRRELQHLVRRAGELLAKHGARATPDAERRISDTLLGAAVDRQSADELRHGSGRFLAVARSPVLVGAHWQWLAVADIAFAGALTYSSGGGYSQLRFAFLFPVVVVAFRGRPLGTAAVAVASTVVYLLQAFPHPSRSNSGANTLKSGRWPPP